MVNKTDHSSKIIGMLYTQYKSNGFITEDEALELMIEYSLPLNEVDKITEQLLAMGILILTDQDDLKTTDDENDYDRSQTDYSALFDRIIEIDTGLKNFIDEVREIQPPQHREWINLMPQAKAGNKYAHNRLFEMYLRVVIKIALWHHDKYDAPIADAIQDGCIGLITAIEKFEFGKQNLFTTYAPWWIRQVIIRELQFQPNTIFYIPVHYKDKLFAIYEIAKAHSCEKCRKNDICPVLTTEVADKLDCSTIDANQYLWFFLSPFSIETLDELFLTDSGFLVDDMIDGIALNTKCQELYRALDTIRPVQKEVLVLRYGLFGGVPKTLEEVGEIRGVTRERIRQIEKVALTRMRHPSRRNMFKRD